MTDSELDEYFISTLKAALVQLAETAEYEKKYSYETKDEVVEELEANIKLLKKICSTIKTVDDLAEMEEDAVTASFEAIAAFAENFVIGRDAVQREKDMEEYDRLQELLYLFCDDEED